MIESFELENFKAFGKSRRIDLAPITLVFGENSAGKSSLLQSLNLLKQTRESREQGVLLLPRSESGIVDLGSFHEMLFDHDASRTLRFRFNLSRPPRKSGKHLASSGVGDSTFGFEMGFKRAVGDNEVNLEFLRLYSCDHDDELIATYEPAEIDETEENFLMRNSFPFWDNGRGIKREKLRAAKCTHITKSTVVWEKVFKAWFSERATVVEALETFRDETHGRKNLNQRSLFNVENEFNSAIEEAIAFYSREFSVDEFIERAASAELASIVLLDGFIPMRLRHDGQHLYPEFQAARYFHRRVRTGELESIDSAMLLASVGSQLEGALESLFPMGPFRQAPKRLYIFTGTTPQDVGYDGNLLPDLLFRRKKLVEEANEWLDRLEIGYHIWIKPVGTHQNDLFEVRLKDRRRTDAIDVALSDVGFGISQLLPFVVQTLAATNQIITIEQPEVHVHPRLQSDLGDLLIEGIQEQRGHRFIVETHSEHLILRLLRRIRETTNGELPEGHPGLTPDQLSVVYLERGEDGAVVHRLKVNKEGDFVNQWPKGFFEERAKELF